MTLVTGKTYQATPTKVADASPGLVPLTFDQLGAAWASLVWPADYGPTQRGQAFTAMNPTIGTGIAQSIQTSFSATNCIGLIRNNDPKTDGTGKSIYFGFLKLLCTVAGASSTASDFAVVIDPTSTTRYSSGGTALTPQNLHSGLATGSIAQVYFGAVTATAASASVRPIDQDHLKTQAAPCWTVGDSVLLTTRGSDYGPGNLSGSAALRIVAPIRPFVLAPGHSALFHLWNTANATTAPSWAPVFAWWEA